MTSAIESGKASPHVLNGGSRLWDSDRALLYFLVIVAFVAGCIVGSMYSATSITGRMREAINNPTSHSQGVFEQLNRQLALTAVQIPEAKKLVTIHFENSEEIRRNNLPAVLQEFDRFEKELAEILSDTQKQKWKDQANWIRQNCYGVTH